MSEQTIRQLQTDQNRCLKICLRLDRRTNTDYVHAKANCPKLVDRHEIHLLNYMYTRSRDPTCIYHRALCTRAYEGPLVKVLRANGATYSKVLNTMVL